MYWHWEWTDKYKIIQKTEVTVVPFICSQSTEHSLFHRWKLVINDLSQLFCLQQWKAASGCSRAGWSIYCGRVEMDQQWFSLIEMHCGVSKLAIFGTNACLFLWAFSTVWKPWCFISMSVLENPHKVDFALDHAGYLRSSPECYSIFGLWK